MVDYVWIGGEGELRSKTRVIYNTVNSLEDVPTWNYDGSSTGQADGLNSEIFIHPKRLFRCPFRRSHDFIVLCDAYTPDGKPAKYNHRYYANKIFEKYADQKPWYGLEQEYFIYDCDTHLPVNFNPDRRQGPYYCSVGGNNAFCREISEEHLFACLRAGIKISGTNAEVAPAQWEYQVGPVEGIDAADQLWISRYLLEKIAEKYDKYIVYHPKPLKGDWNGSGCHCNFSTKIMRDANGLNMIYHVIRKLEKKHMEHMEIYGEHNDERMTGLHETARYDTFTYGIANRNASIRIPVDTVRNGRGYIEDRRPAANCDPYLVTAKILETVMEN
ncbi:MAG: glutamine synthetase beta-grasp domain-containing protein [Nitrososphaerota archaeon]